MLSVLCFWLDNFFSQSTQVCCVNIQSVSNKHTHYSGGYRQTFHCETKMDLLYVRSQDSANRMKNSNNRRSLHSLIQNSGGALNVRETQDYCAVVLEI